MKKRMISLALALMMCFSLSVTAFATTAVVEGPDISLQPYFEAARDAYYAKQSTYNARNMDAYKSFVATLTSNDGAAYEVQMFPMDEPITELQTSSSENSFAAILSLEPQYMRSISDTEDKYALDSSYSVYAYVCIYYTQEGSADAETETYQMTSISGYWDIRDSTVNITDRRLSYYAGYESSEPHTPVYAYGTPITSNSFRYSVLNAPELNTALRFNGFIYAGTYAKLYRGVPERYWELTVQADLLNPQGVSIEFGNMG